ncbi:uncharacterized protein [Linepithema humile]|uniref:uncharacterized protein n=1 Tax=Linepithema humile TaxID=83485 RepID=UPI0006231C7D|nr:PREDICTED: uncharacterized protein LOC105678853 [Linepithema humile]
MYLCDLIFSALIISIVRFSMSIDIQSEKRTLIMQLSPKPLTDLEDIPDRWKIVQSEFRVPQIEIYLMKDLLKDYVSPNEDSTFSKEYKYSNKDYNAAEKVTSTTDEKKVPQIGNAKENKKENSDAQDNIVMPDRIIPQIGSRNIIVVPEYCPKGQRKDSKGRCRVVITK